MKGEMAWDVAETNDLEKAKRIAKDLDNELTSDQWDNLENHWVLDTVTDESIEIYD